MKNFFQRQSIKNIVLIGISVAILWQIIFRYILPIFNTHISPTSVLIEEIIHPIVSGFIPLLLFAYALLIWVLRIIFSMMQKLNNKK